MVDDVLGFLPLAVGGCGHLEGGEVHAGEDSGLHELLYVFVPKRFGPFVEAGRRLDFRVDRRCRLRLPHRVPGGFEGALDDLCLTRFSRSSSHFMKIPILHLCTARFTHGIKPSGCRYSTHPPGKD